jgi:hypothetical protein
MAVPDKPSGVHRSTGNGAVSVFFNMNTAGAAVSGYRLVRGTSHGGPYDTVVADGLVPGAFEQLSPTQYDKIDTGLTNGTAYYYIVIAYNGDGDSVPSDEVSGTPLDTTDGTAFQFWELDNGLLPEMTVVAGQSYPSRLFWLNTGTSTWSEDNFYRNAVKPLTDTDWTVQRHLLRDGDIVLPGAVGTFRATIIAPALPGAYTFDWMVNQEALHTDLGDMPAYTMTVLPAAPGSVEAEGGCAQIALSWDLTVGATGYRVYRRLSPTDPWTRIATPSATSYTDSGVAPGQTYAYYVTAVAATGETPTFLCPIVTAASVVPARVSGLAATAGDGSIGLSWSAAAGATSYDVYRATAPGAEGETPLASGVTATGYTDTAVMNGVAYYYTVRAMSDCGTGAASAEAGATPQCCLGAWNGASPCATTWTSGGGCSTSWTAGSDCATSWAAEGCP